MGEWIAKSSTSHHLFDMDVCIIALVSTYRCCLSPFRSFPSPTIIKTEGTEASLLSITGGTDSCGLTISCSTYKCAPVMV